MERKTKQRGAILEALEVADRPLSTQEILGSARDKIPKIGIATVYRTIKDFLRMDVVTEVELPGNLQRYEVKSKDHHHHFWCRVCDRVYRVETCPGTLNFGPPAGFKAEEHAVTFRGLCATCVG